MWAREPGSSAMRCTLIFYGVHDILTRKINHSIRSLREGLDPLRASAM